MNFILIFYYEHFTVPSEGFDRFSSLFLKRELYRNNKTDRLPVCIRKADTVLKLLASTVPFQNLNRFPVVFAAKDGKRQNGFNFLNGTIRAF